MSPIEDVFASYSKPAPIQASYTSNSSARSIESPDPRSRPEPPPHSKLTSRRSFTPKSGISFPTPQAQHTYQQTSPIQTNPMQANPIQASMGKTITVSNMPVRIIPNGGGVAFAGSGEIRRRTNSPPPRYATKHDLYYLQSYKSTSY